MIHLDSLLVSRELKGRTRTATFTEAPDILAACCALEILRGGGHNPSGLPSCWRFLEKKKSNLVIYNSCICADKKKRLVQNSLTWNPPCKHPSHATSCYFKAITGNTLNSTCMLSPYSKVSVIQGSSFEAYKQICFHCLVFFPERGANTK